MYVSVSKKKHKLIPFMYHCSIHAITNTIHRLTYSDRYTQNKQNTIINDQHISYL